MESMKESCKTVVRVTVRLLRGIVVLGASLAVMMLLGWTVAQFPWWIGGVGLIVLFVWAVWDLGGSW